MSLSEYFSSIAYKKLSAVEADAARSHQHEFNGTGALKKVFGDAKKAFSARFVYLAETQGGPLVADVDMTWYDARENHPERTEYRLYYKAGAINEYMEEGDLMVIAIRPDGRTYIFIAQKNSTYENQLALLFDLPSTIGTIMESKDVSRAGEGVGFVRSFILEEIGIEIKEVDENYLEILIRKFPKGFPNTVEFSDFARSTLPNDVDVREDPDTALLRWMEREELLFRTLERYLMAEKIRTVGEDVDKFIQLSLSMQNRRKSRVGLALENHLETIFTDLKVPFVRGKETENNSKPDFIFPSIESYRDPKFSDAKLFMLGAKSTCKDRWRQVLAEAARIKNKHLLTLEPGISVNQTNEMQTNNLNLVLPKALFSTYTNDQQKWLMDLKGFISLIGAGRK